ncbi:MAG: hypothetical protein IJR35_07045 [Synergistaceae bacterium]|nr:hypothetical protein [Synergistaceae bacterium]MBQ9595602.1 hypothetical protein [Synergistaceae bacterium]MBR0204067.1 hypothetical protein [Synergistaceae bacterium]
MKRYTSPAVTNSDSVSFIAPLAALFGPSSVVVDSPRPYSSLKIFGEDFTGLQVDPLMPCLES